MEERSPRPRYEDSGPENRKISGRSGCGETYPDFFSGGRGGIQGFDEFWVGYRGSENGNRFFRRRDEAENLLPSVRGREVESVGDFPDEGRTSEIGRKYGTEKFGGRRIVSENEEFPILRERGLRVIPG
ncbi:MAG: hypothetical protein QG650_97 [Patescibacteria group bacterium]|nr:hypothetical protein [Patescibacteria group bacterium]